VTQVAGQVKSDRSWRRRLWCRFFEQVDHESADGWSVKEVTR